MACKTMWWQVLLLISFFLRDIHGQVTYSIPEEMSKGSLVGSITQDLGLELKRLMSGKARIYTGDGTEYIGLDKEKGTLFIKEKMDREALCGKTTPCALHLQVILENPMEFSNVTVQIIIQDQNDNAPQVLYPVQTSSSVVAEIVPRSADIGYLVTKVVAVDVDSGQNAWLSYKLHKVGDRPLFEVGAQNGEIRTVRQVTDKDAVKQKLTVVVEDNGQPSRSATVNVNVAVADSFPELLSEITDFTHKDYNGDLTFYLVVALVVVSFLFIACLVAIISVKIYRWRQAHLYQSNLPVIPYYPPHYTDTGGTGTLKHMYNYEVCMTADSRKGDGTFLRPTSQNVLIMDSNATETMKRIQKEQLFLDDLNSPDQVRPLVSLNF
ncbi:protocadherin gamma-A10-like [Alosa pseudoharengus]|uniref:protocadherin gamma-A10-like n=1 Tax=Alosa pseudoharengus TaxID=34774 RepID=UPI003F8B4386